MLKYLLTTIAVIFLFSFSTCHLFAEPNSIKGESQMNQSSPNKPPAEHKEKNTNNNLSQMNKATETRESKIQSKKQTQQGDNKTNLKIMTIYEWSNIIILALVLFVTATYAYFSYLQWIALRDTVNVSQRSAEAAKKSADIGEKTLISTQRPWIKIVDVKLRQPIIFAAQGINVGINYQLMNVGITPAKDVKFIFEVFISNSDQDRITFEELKDSCIKMKGKDIGFPAIGGIVGYLFPNEESREIPISQNIPISHFEKVMGRKIDTFKSLLIIAYVTYKFPFDDTVHITGVPYFLSRKNGTPIFPVQKDDTIISDGKAHGIMEEKLVLSEMWEAYAD